MRSSVVGKTIEIRRGLQTDHFSAITSDTSYYVKLSSEVELRLSGNWRLGASFEKTGWLQRRQLALSPQYSVACAGVNKNGQFAIIFYNSESNERAVYMTTPVPLRRFSLSYDASSRQFCVHMAVAHGKGELLGSIAFLDRRNSSFMGGERAFPAVSFEGKDFWGKIELQQLL
jgi:hypothetical protein